MKLDRLIAILSVLLNREQITAPELAKRFEVSRRTINRDIEALNRAGIPVVTQQGAGGGIRIMDGFRMDRTALTSGDMQAILAGLRSLDSVSGTNQYRQLMEKISPGSSDLLSGDQYIMIDLASWHKASSMISILLFQRMSTTNSEGCIYSDICRNKCRNKPENNERFMLFTKNEGERMNLKKLYPAYVSRVGFVYWIQNLSDTV